MGILGKPFKKSEVTTTIDTHIKLSPGESLEKTAHPEKMSKPTLDEQWRNISRQSQIHLKQGDLGLYACDLYGLSEICRKEAHYNDQMKLLIISAYIHLSGFGTITEYNYWKNGDSSTFGMTPLLPPAIRRSTQTCMKRLNMTWKDYETLFHEYAVNTLTPVHVLGIEQSLKVIHTYLNGDEKKADKMAENGTKKFFKEHSTKRR